MKTTDKFRLLANGYNITEENLTRLNSAEIAKKANCEKQMEINKLLSWFAGYDIKVAEHLRCSRLGLVCEHNIVELDILAEQNKSRLKILKNN